MGKTIFRMINGRVVPMVVDEEIAGNNGTMFYVSTPKHKTNERKLSHKSSFVIPNATCQKCGKDVFYYENSFGSRVLFDSLGLLGQFIRVTVLLLRKKGNYYQPKIVCAFPVHGESMEPIIPNGTTVFVNCNDKKIVDGGVYFIEQDDLFRVKVLLRLPGGKLIISSYNSVDYPDEIADIESVKVVGRVFNMSVMLI